MTHKNSTRVRRNLQQNGVSVTNSGNSLSTSSNGTHTFVNDGNCERVFNGTNVSISQSNINGVQTTTVNGKPFECSSPSPSPTRGYSTPPVTSSASRAGGSPNLALGLVAGAVLANSLGLGGGSSSRSKKKQTKKEWGAEVKRAKNAKNISNSIG